MNHAAVNPIPAEHMLVIHTAGKISKGVLQPIPARTAATLAGISCMEAVFSTISLHISSVATPGRVGFSMRFVAAMPMGVAALPNPKMFAQILPLR